MCQEYEVAFRKNYESDASLIEPSVGGDAPPAAEPPKTVPRDLTDLLSESIGEKFERVGRTSIYRSPNKTVLARWSQRYNRKTENYWYGLTAKDIETIREDALTHLGYVCGTL